ncbi:2-dehydropantoate 2-reductase [uncultured Metabacillus sp.]|uniref:2-dehydropantoate 2-reductase n=1 Tax=uncultured Metabacillus sp. TaxID=2860135 RepID=UPI0026187FBD|nr:2-dehydropantoate 2-reductase [uncultured Metabacillus sp.]
MEIGIIGGGSIGLLYSFYLSKNHVITLYTKRKEQADLINQNGLSMLKDGTHVKTSIKADFSSNYKEQLLIVTVKQYDIEQVISLLKNQSPRTVLFLQNGMGHITYLSSLTEHQILLGIAEHGALRADDNTVHHTGVGVTKISPYSQKNKCHFIFDQLLREQDPSFPIEIKVDWKKMLSEKLVVNATINPLTAVLHVKNGLLIENRHYKKILHELFLEVVHILGLEKEKYLWDHVQSICKNTSENSSSMLKDVQSGRQTEIDSILGYLINQAVNTNKSYPHITFLYHAIKGMESVR